MTIVSAVFVTVLFTGGSYLLLRRSLFDLILGMALLSAGTNVLLITMSGWEAASQPPFLAELGHSASHVSEKESIENRADPLPQALILTALVIGFGFLSFLMALVSRSKDNLKEPVDAKPSVGSDSS